MLILPTLRESEYRLKDFDQSKLFDVTLDRILILKDSEFKILKLIPLIGKIFDEISFLFNLSNDLTNSGATAIGANPYSPKEGIWQRNGKTSSGYAPECQQDYRIGKVYAVYPASTNNIEFCVCFKEPCSDSSNRLQNTLTVR